MSVAYPTKPGGSIFASDSDSISTEIDVSGLPIGSLVWNEDAGSFFKLTISTADLVTDQILEVLGISGARWISVPALSDLGTNKLNAYDYDGWFSDAVSIMRTAVPALTNFREIKVGDIPSGDTLANAALGTADVEGGGYGGAAATSFRAFSKAVTSAPASGAYAFAFRANLAAPVTGKTYFVGLLNAAGSHFLGVGSIYDFSVAARTNYLLYTYDGQEVATDSGVAIDAGFHTFVVTFDGTTLTLFIDGVSVATLTDLTGITDEPMFLAQYYSDLQAAITVRIAYGYVAP